MVDRAGRVVVAVVVMSGFGGCDSAKGQPVTVLRGKTITVNDQRTAIDFEGKRVSGPKFDFIDVEGGWRVAGADWYDGKSWQHDGTAPCLEKPAPQQIEMGVIEAAASEDGGAGRGVVVWLKCL